MLEKKYDHKQVEENKYSNWLEKGYFNCGDKTKVPYTIVIPPPNVTGKLHLGHAWDTTLQDIIIRYKKMQGFDTLWLPGMDHAAIATEVKVVEKLKKEGINKRDLGREGFLEKAWEWKEEYAASIRSQWAKLGLALDYTKERFTLDEGLNQAVKKVFIDLYNEGLIYRGERIINWDPIQKTALSNEEVIYKDIEGAFYHLKYYIEGTDEYLQVATTRPETLFGDTAVAVNPEDDRYKHLIGKNVILPIANKPIPVVGDEHADPNFGTGVVKITPAHDPNDFEVGNRHDLPRIKVINEDATMNENAFKYCGMDRFECRKVLIEDLEKEDLLIKIEKMTHSVGHSERTGVVIEPYLSKQWFVKMESLAENVLKNQAIADKKVNFVPERFEKILTNWMSDCHDWCISRQLWWGHRIPAWYKDEEVYVGEEAPKEEGWKQDEDVLDTWFSSALWPFSTLGWPNNTEDFERYFPNDVLVTGYDIIFFWVCRMVFQSLKFTGKAPFKDCLIHGLIRDKEGRKMSKSLGNGVDPMDVIDTYGADSLRYFITTNSAPGQDLRYDEDKVKSTWNFINKIWNASRFVLMNIGEFKEEDKTYENLSSYDKWILTKYNNVVENVTKHMDKYEFNVVGSELYSFIWNDFCDNYIEFAKIELASEEHNTNTTKTVLLEVLEGIIKMLHPFMPFVTEELYLSLPIHNESIMLSEYPKYSDTNCYDKEKEEVEKIMDIITTVRNFKAENNIGKEYYLKFDFNDEKLVNSNNLIISKLLKAEILNELKGDMIQKTVSTPYGNIIVCFEGEKITDEDIAEMEKEKEKLISSIERREKLLSNAGYVAKAPENIVSEERNKLASEKDKLEVITKTLESLK